jgi:hypothetical protein
MGESAGSVKPTPMCVGFQSHLTRLSGFPTETHARPLFLAEYKERSGISVGSLFLSSSLFFYCRPVCMGWRGSTDFWPDFLFLLFGSLYTLTKKKQNKKTNTL